MFFSPHFGFSHHRWKVTYSNSVSSGSESRDAKNHCDISSPTVCNLIGGHSGSTYKANFNHRQRYDYGRSDNFKLDRHSSRGRIWYTRGYGLLFRFFMRPKLEVRIIERTELSTDLAARAVYSLGFPPRHIEPIAAKNPRAMMQSIGIAARKSSVKIGARVWLRPSTYPMHLNWESPQEMSVKAWEGQAVMRPQYLELEADDEYPVWIWAASVVEGQSPWIFINVKPVLRYELDKITNKELHLDIQFLPIEKKPRKFRLIVDSWDSLQLVERKD